MVIEAIITTTLDGNYFSIIEGVKTLRETYDAESKTFLLNVLDPPAKKY